MPRTAWKRMILTFFLLGAVLAAAPVAHADETPAADSPVDESTADSAPDAGVKHALIICGHPGDDEHRALYAETVEKLSQALTARLGFSAERIRVQFGSPKTDDDGPAISSARGMATGEEIQAEVADLRKQLTIDDTLWVIVLGHAHYDGRDSYLNLPGADMPQDDFAKLFAGIPSREQLFFITTAVSGFFTRSLSAPNRIVITATEADLEVNETRFHLALAELLLDPPEKKELDADGDGAISIFDLYIAIARNVAQRYLDEQLYSTEHAQLDDNGDKRGVELQLDYLTVEQGGRESGAEKPKIRPNSDGALASRTLLRIQWPAKATSDAESDAPATDSP